MAGGWGVWDGMLSSGITLRLPLVVQTHTHTPQIGVLAQGTAAVGISPNRIPSLKHRKLPQSSALMPQFSTLQKMTLTPSAFFPQPVLCSANMNGGVMALTIYLWQNFSSLPKIIVSQIMNQWLSDKSSPPICSVDVRKKMLSHFKIGNFYIKI